MAEGAGYTLSGHTAKDAGDYAAIATPDSNHRWDSGEAALQTVAATFNYRIIPAPIQPPQAVQGLIENGSEQTGVPEGAGYSLSGHRAAAAGAYTARAVLDDKKNTVWTDTKNSLDLELAWSIGALPDPIHPAIRALRNHPDTLYFLEKADTGTEPLAHRVTGRMAVQEGMALRASLAVDSLAAGEGILLKLPGRLARQLMAHGIHVLEIRALEHRLRLNLTEIAALEAFEWDGWLLARIVPDEHGAPRPSLSWLAADGAETALAPELLPGSGIVPI